MNREEILQNLRRIEEMESGELHFQYIVELEKNAGTNIDEGLQFDIKDELIKSAIFAGHEEQALIAFPALLKLYDNYFRDDWFNTFRMLWKYKYIVNNIYKFPMVKKDKILELCEDFKRRLQETNNGLQAYYKSKCMFLSRSGDIEEARELMEQWMASDEIGAISDCKACCQNDIVSCYLNRKEYEQAFQAAKPILDGDMVCGEIPHLTLGQLLLPYLRCGEKEKADELNRKGYRLVSRNPMNFLDVIALHIQYEAVTKPKAALNKIEKHMQAAFGIKNMEAKLEFLIAATMTFENMKRMGRKRIKMHMPEEFPKYMEDGSYAVEELVLWFQMEARRIAEQFDLRNGNGFHTAELVEKLKWVEMADEYALESATGLSN